MKKKAFTLIELLTVIVIISILMILVIGMARSCSKSQGVRAGILTKFSYKGMFASTKSWEGDLTLSGLVESGEGGVSANVWHFSVLDASLAKKLEDMVGKPVKLRYDQTMWHNPMTRDTSYLVTAVEEVAPANKQPTP